ncbi:ABC-2 family transporter protein [Candidatus Dojkabacteria bacterium]|nr:ABC-2 family transporter protein [Candidatus Dojkabacteria bacterium]
MRKIKVWIQFVVLYLKQFAVYRFDMLFRLFSMILMTGIMYVVLTLPYEHVDEIAGWKKNEAILILGFYYISNGLAWVLYRTGISNLESKINSGSLDEVLLRPVGSSFYVSYLEADVSRISDVLVGVVFVGINIGGMNLTVGVLEVFGVVLSLVVGVSIVKCIFLMVNSLAFWTTETYLDHVASPLVVLTKYPVDLWGKSKEIFYWGIPMAFLSTVPAAILVGKLEWWYGIVGIGLALMWNVFAETFWRFGLRFYSGASR